MNDSTHSYAQCQRVWSNYKPFILEQVLKYQFLSEIHIGMRPSEKCGTVRALGTSTPFEEEGRIRRSKLMSSTISAVEICIKNGHWPEAFYLASGDPDLTRSVQDQYLNKTFDMMDMIPKTEGQPNWRRVVRFCDLEKWEHTLKVLVSNVHNEEELSSVVGLLGRRLELSENERLRRSAVACWLCTGNLDAAAKVWSSMKMCIVASSDLEFLEDLKKCLDVWKNRGVDNVGNRDQHSFLSAPKPMYQQWSASCPVHQMPSSYMVPSSFHPAANQYRKPAFPAYGPPCFMTPVKVPVGPLVPQIMTRPTIQAPAFNMQPQLQSAVVPPPVAVISQPLSPNARPFTPKNSSTEPSKTNSATNGFLPRLRSPSETSTTSSVPHISEVSFSQFYTSDEDFYEEPPSCEEQKCDVDLTENVRKLIRKYCCNGYMDSKTDDKIFAMILSKAEYWKTKFDTAKYKR